jgi:hypothetical protein
VQPIEAFERLTDIAMTAGPPLAILAALLLVQALCVVVLVVPPVWMSVAVVRAAGWRGVFFVTLLWSAAWRIAAGS